MIRLLVIAPSPTFRNSLRFALEAEGYNVTAVAAIGDVDRSRRDFACTVLDHHGIGGDAEDARAFMRSFAPVVLLANTAAHLVAPLSFRTLTKPSLGPALSEAVRAAVASREGAK